MEATIFIRSQEKRPDGSTVSIIIWQLPHPTKDRPHGYKYRLNYSLKDGTLIVRYDNKIGKGDHKHIGTDQMPYSFVNVDKLVDDFLADIRNAQSG
jgi:hypothetical protein